MIGLTDAEFEFIVSRVVANAYDALKEAEQNKEFLGIISVGNHARKTNLLYAPTFGHFNLSERNVLIVIVCIGR